MWRGAIITADAQVEHGHGREETRSYVVIPDPQGIRDQEEWPKLRVVGVCYCERTVKGKTSFESRYFIGSKQVRRDTMAALYGTIGESKTICTGNWMSLLMRTAIRLRTAKGRQTWPWSENLP